MAEFQAASSVAPARAPFAIESKLLWEQETPILDVALLPDSMLVLDTAGLIRYERREGKWERAAAVELPVVVRDPRGRLETNGRLYYDPRARHHVHGADKNDGASAVRGRWTLQSRSQHARPARLARRILHQCGTRRRYCWWRNVDGRIHIYDAAHAPQAVFDGWGSDFAVIAACGGRHVAVSGCR